VELTFATHYKERGINGGCTKLEGYCIEFYCRIGKERAVNEGKRKKKKKQMLHHKERND
jgi:hypothetical protein